jgi:hypothetical protein
MGASVGSVKYVLHNSKTMKRLQEYSDSFQIFFGVGVELSFGDACDLMKTTLANKHVGACVAEEIEEV